MRRVGIAALVAICLVAPAVPAVAAPAVVWPAPAVSIVLERSGGFAGRSETFAVDQATVGGRKALWLVATPEFRRLRGSYLPVNACCDRFGYRLEVTYRYGLRKTVTTVQGTPAPQILGDVLAEVQRVGAQPSLAAGRAA
ncbi:hypothetical protein [Paractinoplanes durhamensis]|uniref:hypothetical protein n=1 Tax=Paractinoplanes durhamensis TaxID=113563 RepID=UPI0019405A53|nr:hypothetical protein [Actinoplanes durhamensis]